ncbi:hypothetical protein [Yinghuangia seranimata]|uniref:hypothetical protein n=1 Tax=Yinghuangia seranimata TaxID=408067 RepID=UPI00248A9C6E|nr:hypothetical protein [Yinghuangia seranimata]MDI2124849.1 hypothetical protein [Yinghuangia seranimata]
MQPLRRAATAAATALFCLGSVLFASTTATARADTWGTWVSSSNGKCLTLFPDNDVIGLATCEAGRQTQLWTNEFVDEGQFVYQLRNAAGGCLWAENIQGVRYAYRTTCNANDKEKRFVVANGYISPDFARGMKLMVTKAYGIEIVAFTVPADYNDPRVRWTYHPA